MWLAALSKDHRTPNKSTRTAQTEPATKPNGLLQRASDDELCYRFNFMTASAGHAARTTSAWYASRQHTRPRPAPYCSQPSASIPPQPMLGKGKKRATQPEQAWLAPNLKPPNEACMHSIARWDVQTHHPPQWLLQTMSVPHSWFHIYKGPPLWVGDITVWVNMNC